MFMTVTRVENEPSTSPQSDKWDSICGTVETEDEVKNWKGITLESCQPTRYNIPSNLAFRFGKWKWLD